MTDLDRLHKVVTGQLTDRGVGKTYAHCHDVAAVVALEQFREVLLVVEQYRDLNHILPMLHQVFEEYRLPLRRTRLTTFYSGDVMLRVVSISDFEYQAAGLRDFAEVRFHREYY